MRPSTRHESATQIKHRKAEARLDDARELRDAETDFGDSFDRCLVRVSHIQAETSHQAAIAARVEI
ncbi:hypothetical protein [Methylopila sp. Yamaguchi]|uniref:hypothetical protein n=1 Tax=Methylopila sp. Yamaguchi TaxID=1437817 RepID=UPI0011AFB13D|nr:hypothetical protein [Methylopila sp. Yamaguchi]